MRVVACTQLGNDLSSLKQELDSFGARFRTNRLVDLVINQNMISETTNKIYETVVIEKWLGPPPDMAKKQHDTLELHKAGTGRWFLKGSEFMEWQDNPGALWIQGPSGSGKSVLSSAVIKKLIDDRKFLKEMGKSSAVAFFYFDFKNKESHAVESALRRIILQLSAQAPNRYRALDKHYSLSSGQALPTYQDLQDILKELLLELGRTYIVLDGLDECQDIELIKLVDLISMLWSWTQTPVHLLITSQPRSIFTDNFGAMTCVSPTSEVTAEDIRSFVDSELQSSRYKLKAWASRSGGPNITDITDQIVHKSNGMFRLAACLLFEISHCKWLDKLKETLENLPTDLFGVYGRFVERIPKKDLVYVAAVLRWMIFSADNWIMQMDKLDNLADAIAIDFSDPEKYTYCPSRRDDNRVAIVEWLEGLVTIFQDSKGNQQVILAHASVQDYLLSRQFTDIAGFDLSEKLSHTFLAQSCIGHLLHFADHPLDPGNYYRKFPCAMYAAEYWCHHLLRSHDQSILFNNAMHLLVDGSPQWAAMCALHWDSDLTPLCWLVKEGFTEGVQYVLKNGVNVHSKDYREGLWIACKRGLREIVHLFLENGTDVHGPREEDGSLLHIAACNGHTDIVSLFLEKGADANAHGEYGRLGNHRGSTLKAASNSGYTEIVHLLLENGALVDGHEEEGGTSLHAAASNGHMEIVGILLGKGANVNAHGRYQDLNNFECCGSTLKAVSDRGHTEIVQLLLANGAEVNGHKEDDGSPLHVAARNGHTDIVSLLLGKGADANTHGKYGWQQHLGSALKAACDGGHTDTVHLLLYNGANIHEHEEEGGSSLEVAASKGYTFIVSLLVENGADVNAQSKEYGSALKAACGEGYMETLCLLLENGAIVNGAEEEDGSPLHAAASNGHTEIVGILLGKGANVNAHGKYGWEQHRGSVLKAACEGGHLEIVHLLLDKGANIHGHEKEDGSPLEAAASRGNTDIVRLLLDKGANANAQSKIYGSALQAACRQGHINTVHLLLENGADTDGQKEGGGSSLCAAASNGHTEVVSLLLGKGADANAHGTYLDSNDEVRRGSVLKVACVGGYMETVRLLHDNGANLDGDEEEDGSPLHAAASEGHTDIVGLLLGEGADANTHGKYVDSNWQEHRGSTLKAACHKGHGKIARLLLCHGADINGHEEEGGSPLEVAASEGYTYIVHLLLEKGADVNAQSKKYGTALRTACRNGHADIVRLLLAKGVDITTQGGRALQVADRERHTDVVGLLLEKGAVRATTSAETEEESEWYTEEESEDTESKTV
ncbi:ankyrin repeat-containing domain protein [Mycena epipterygia]|nr:ankyrin repeat-containing domain protein [Mycena epipterygia]